MRLSRALLFAVFLVWAALMMAKMTFVHDGLRYFTLGDDAMISMRYAWNLAHGHGLVWNAGERVEGYTNFLFTLLMAVPQFFLSERWSVLFVQILGLGLCLATALLLPRLASRLVARRDATPSAVLIGTFLLLAYFPFVYWAIRGMETTLLAWLFTASLIGILELDAGDRRSLGWLPFALAGMSLTRPDATAFVGVLLAYLWLAQAPRLRTKLVATIFAIYLVPVLAHLAFRYAYYHDFIPNTARLKLGGLPLSLRLVGGIAFLKPFLWQTAGASILLLSSVIFRASKPKLLVATLFATAIAYQIYVGGDPWPLWRILVPVLPAVFLIVGDELIALASFVARYVTAKGAMVAVGLASLGLAVMFNRPFRLQYTLGAMAHYADVDASNTQNALMLNEILLPGATLGVFWAGVLPYYSYGRPAIDFLGKCDRRIASLPPNLSPEFGWGGMPTVPGHNKFDLHYSIEQLRPTYIQGFQWFDQNLYATVQRDYVLVHMRGVSFLIRRDAPEVNWSKVTSIEPLPAR